MKELAVEEVLERWREQIEFVPVAPMDTVVDLWLEQLVIQMEQAGIRREQMIEALDDNPRAFVESEYGSCLELKGGFRPFGEGFTKLTPRG